MRRRALSAKAETAETSNGPVQAAAPDSQLLSSGGGKKKHYTRDEFARLRNMVKRTDFEG